MSISVRTVLAGLVTAVAFVWAASMLLSDVRVDQGITRGTECGSTVGIAVDGAVGGGEPQPDDEAYESACADAAKTRAMQASLPAVLAIASFTYFVVRVRRDHRMARSRREKRLRDAGVNL